MEPFSSVVADQAMVSREVSPFGENHGVVSAPGLTAARDGATVSMTNVPDVVEGPLSQSSVAFSRQVYVASPSAAAGSNVTAKVDPLPLAVANVVSPRRIVAVQAAGPSSVP